MFILISGLALTLASSGSRSTGALLLVIAVSAQIVSGAIWWTLIVGDRPTPIEVLGAGLSLGTMSSAIGSYWLSGVAGSNAWLLSVVGTVMLLLRKKVRQNAVNALNLKTEWRDLFGISAALAAGFLSVANLWATHPITDSIAPRYDPDIIFFQGIVTAYGSFGAMENPYVAGTPLRYHILAFSWSGAMEAWSMAQSFVVLTRLVPIVSLIGTTCVGWAIASRLTKSKLISTMSCFLLVASDYVGLGSFPGLGDFLVQGKSPSHSFSTPWLLTFVLFLIVRLQNHISSFGSCFLFVILAYGLIGGKVSHAVVVSGGLLILGLREVICSRKLINNSTYICVCSIVGILLGYVTLIDGVQGAPTFSAQFQLPDVLNLSPMEGSLAGSLIGLVCFVLAAAPRWVGLVFLGHVTPSAIRGPLGSFLTGVFVFSMLLTIFTATPGLSNLYFELSGASVLAVFTAVGLCETFRNSYAATPQRTRNLCMVWVSATAMLITVPVVLRLLHEGDLFVELQYPQWLDPWLAYAAMAVVVFPRLMIRRLGKSDQRVPLRLVGVAALLVASLMTFQLGNIGKLVHRFVEGTVDFASETEEDLAAAVFLRANSAESDIVLTNRLCTDTLASPPNCGSKWFLIPTVAERRTWISGHQYAVGPDLPDWALERVKVSMLVANQPTRSRTEELLRLGVKWIWLDCRVSCSTLWNDFAQLRYRTSNIILFELQET